MDIKRESMDRSSATICPARVGGGWLLTFGNEVSQPAAEPLIIHHSSVRGQIGRGWLQLVAGNC